jgi:hypothetical protein
MKLLHRPHHTRMLLLAGAGLLLSAWLAPPYFHAGRYRRLLTAGLESTLGRPVELGTVSFRLLPHPGFSIDHVVIKEDFRFGSEPFARVDRLECDLRWRSLWGSRLDCARILLQRPTLDLVRNNQGEWNFEDFFLRSNPAVRSRAARVERRSPPAVDLDVEDARLNFTTGITKKPFAITGLSGGLTLDPSTGSLHFDFAGTPVRLDLPQPAPGVVELSGEWQPGNRFRGPLRATFHTSGSLLYGWIPLLTNRNPDMYGLVDATIQMAGTIDRLRLTGDIRVTQLHRWDSLPPLSSMPVGISFKGSLDRTREEFYVQHADASFADSRLHLTGAIDRINSSPKVDLVLGVQDSHLRDVLEMASRLSGRHAAWGASGRVNGLLTIQGPWRRRRYGGFIGVRSVQLQAHDLSFNIPQLGIRVDHKGAYLLPVRFYLAHQVQCVAQGAIVPALLGSYRRRSVQKVASAGQAVNASPKRTDRGLGRSLAGRDRYELTVATERAPLHDLLRLARSLGVRETRDLDAEGLADTTVTFSGRAWPFRKPGVSVSADLHQARLLIPGLTEPLRLTRFHLEANHQHIRVNPLVAQLGPVSFSGWLNHQGARENPWTFDASAPKLSMEQASLWFAVLGHKTPIPLFGLIPGLRSLIARRAAGRNIFGSVNAVGRFESPLVTFRHVRLRNVRATVAIARRVATVEKVVFRVAGGVGGGSAKIDFRRAPALISGVFKLQDGKLGNLAWRLPPALRGIRGRISASGRFTTRGLTRQEMSAGFSGQAEVQLRDVSLRNYDPLQAFARAASLGSFEPDPATTRIRFAALMLQIYGQRAVLAPLRLKLAGAVFDIRGDYGFDGKANVYVRADLSRVRRQWLTDSRTSFASRDPAQELAWYSPSNEDPFQAVLLQHQRRADAKSSGRLAPTSGRSEQGGSSIGALHLAGPVSRLALVEKLAAKARP